MSYVVSTKDRAAPIKVFIIRIQYMTSDSSRIGAAYLDEFAAVEEVKRLEAANHYTTASYVTRELTL